MLKMAPSPPPNSTVRSMKNVAVLTEDGAVALFFRPYPGGIDSSRVLPREFAIQGKKKCQYPEFSPGGGVGGGGWAQVELTDA